MTVTEISRCRLCASDRLKALFSLGTPFVSAFVSEAEVKAGYPNCAHAPLETALCEECSLVQLRHSVAAESLYRSGYWFKSSGSKTNKAALFNLVEAAVDRVRPLHVGDVVLDIGSNDGSLLKCYSESVVRVGIEPAENVGTPENYAGLNLIRDLWPTPKFKEWFLDAKVVRDGRPKIVTAAGMLYDVEDPTAFLKGVADVLHPEGSFVAQLTCLRQTVERRDLGNFCHEHLLYFSLRSLILVYEAAGLELIDVEENDVNGGSYRLWAVPAGRDSLRTASGKLRLAEAMDAEDRMNLGSAVTLNRFYQRLLGNAQELKLTLLKARRDGRRVFAYGASTKGNSVLQFAGLDGTLIEAVADKDHDKWGRFTVGSGIPICSPEAFRQLNPDLVLLLPHAFRQEVAEQEREQTWRKRGGKFIVISPGVEVF